MSDDILEAATHWLAAKMAGPTARKHADDCAWHVDQYSWECTCGMAQMQPTVAVKTARQNQYAYIDTKPEPKQWTEAEKRAGEAIANAIRR